MTDAMIRCSLRPNQSGQKRYLNMDLLKDQELEQQIETASA